MSTRTRVNSHSVRSSKPKTIEELHPTAFIIAENIKKISGFYGVEVKELCKAMGGISQATFFRRMKAPYDFTLAEIDNIASALGVSHEMLSRENLQLT